MRVDLAYPFTTDDGVPHAPDETVDLPEGQARRLIRGGRARLAAETPTPPEPPATGDVTEQAAEPGADEGTEQL